MQLRLAAGKTTTCLALFGHFWNAHVLFQGTLSILPLSVSLQTKAALCGRLFSFLFSFPRPSQHLGTICGSPTLPSDCSACLVWWLAPAEGHLRHGFLRGTIKPPPCVKGRSAAACSQPQVQVCDIPPVASSHSALTGSSSADEKKEQQNSGFCKMRCALASLLSVT